MLIDNEQRVYVVNNGDRLGPLTLKETKALFEGHKIGADTYVWFAGMDNWTELKRINSLFEYGQSTDNGIHRRLKFTVNIGWINDMSRAGFLFRADR